MIRGRAVATPGAVLLLAFACWPRPAEQVVLPDSLIAPGESLYTHGDYGGAKTAWTEALNRPGIAGSATEARLLTWLGLVAYRQGEYDQARHLGEQALAQKRQRGLAPVEIAESQNALGLLAWSQGRLHDAVSLFGNALSAFGAAKDRWGVAKTSNNLALVALEFGRFAEARQGFNTAQTAAREIGNPRIEGRAAANLAMIEIWTGDPRAALALLARARQLADSAGDPVGEESALGQSAVAWSVLGDLGRALTTIDTAIAVTRRHRLRPEEANDLEVAASFYDAAGDADRAIQLYDQAQTIHHELGLTVEAGAVFRNKALMRAARGAPEHARHDARRALTLHRKAGARLEEFYDLLALIQLDALAGDHSGSARWLAEARRVRVQLDAPQTRVALALASAYAADRRKDFLGVLATLGPIAHDLQFTGSGAAIEAEWLRTRAFAAIGQLDSAVASGRRSVAAIGRTGETLASPVLRASYTTDRSSVFGDLALVLLRLGRTDEAFALADAARGRALLDHLAGGSDAARGGTLGRDLAERDRLRRAIDALLSRLEEVQTRPRQERGPDDHAAGVELAERLRQARGDYQAILIRLAEREPHRAGLIGARQPSVEEIRSALHPDELLVEYLATPDRLLLFAATRAQLRSWEIPLSLAELENRIRLTRGLISSVERGNADPVLEELYRLLIRPLEDMGASAKQGRLVVIPHGVLSYLPFAALRNPATGRRLIQDRNLVFLPTAAGLPALRSGTNQPGPARPATLFAPFPDRLPATTQETKVVARSLAGSRRLVGARATEAAVRTALTQGGTVHMATHGVMNGVNPLFSSLRLSRGTGSPNDDGRLEVHELIGLGIASPLVFLSGCETALGSARSTAFARGEDYATLAQAFLYAGAKEVVATLWRIDDEGAAAFAEQFYRRLATEPAVEALADAQRDLLGNPRWGHPYYWSGYTVAGAGLTGLAAKAVQVSVSSR